MKEAARKDLQREEERELFDRRVLGEGEFVQAVWEAAEKKGNYQPSAKKKRY